MDATIRRLETDLAQNASDLDTRQRLLAAYVRVGVLMPADLIEQPGEAFICYFLEGVVTSSQEW